MAILALNFDCQCKCECCSSGIFRNYFNANCRLSLNLALKRIREISSLKTPRLHISGGEPLLHPDLIDIIKESSINKLKVFLETNGFFLNENTLINVKNAGVFCINISLDSSSSAVHDTKRGISGSFDKVKNAVLLCKKHKIRCLISTYATKTNIYNGEIFKIINTAKKWGANGIRILPPIPSGNWINEDNVLLSKNDIEYFEARIPFNFLILNRLNLIKCPLKNGYKIYILPDGNLAPCEHLPYIFKNSSTKELNLLPNLINHYDFFKENDICFPRNPIFRKKHLTGQNKKINNPIFI